LSEERLSFTLNNNDESNREIPQQSNSRSHMVIGNEPGNDEPMIASPLAHGEILHGLCGPDTGVVAVAQKVRGEWKENAYSVEDLLQILPAYSGATDVYISQNRFRGWRGVSRLAELTAMYSDLDYYNHPGMADMPVEGVLSVAFEELGRARIPLPSFATATGRGLALVWIHAPVSRAELSKWTLCQTELWRALRDIGADRAATDAARVLRLVGTLNSRSGSLVHSLWEEADYYVWDFDELANEILPSTQQDLPPPLRNPESKASKRLLARSKEVSPRSVDSEPRLTVRSLNEARLSDLHKLMDLRGQERLPSGERDSWMLVAATCLSRVMEPEYLEREVYKLAEEVAGWNKRETRTRMQQVFARSKAASREDQVLWEGSWKDPRYEFTNARIIDMLNITPEEERQLKTIISDRTKGQRDRERKETQRRSRGVKPREEYLAQQHSKREQVYNLHERGHSKSEIARRTGYTPRHVYRLLTNAKRLDE
jgi:DNA-binding CsgD family transcriptional regulator